MRTGGYIPGDDGYTPKGSVDANMPSLPKGGSGQSADTKKIIGDGLLSTISVKLALLRENLQRMFLSKRKRRMTETEMTTWIDEASYVDLLRKLRHAPIGDPIFNGDVGVYFMEVFRKRKIEVGVVTAMEANKEVGWDG